jgi:hypothetical protein
VRTNDEANYPTSIPPRVRERAAPLRLDVLRSPFRQASRPDQPTQIGRIRYRLADTICWRGFPSLLQTSPVSPQSDQNP